jgi:hypothetical protein
MIETDASGLPERHIGKSVFIQFLGKRLQGILCPGCYTAGAHADDDLDGFIRAVPHFHFLLFFAAQFPELFKGQFRHGTPPVIP